MAKKTKYTIYKMDVDGKAYEAYTFDDYDDVQNLIGYMVHGKNINTFIVHRQEVEDAE